MKTRPKRSDLTLDYIKSVLDYDPETGLFKWKGNQWTGRSAGTINSDGYMKIAIQRLDFKAHRLAWAIFYGEMLDSTVPIDHINGTRTDNRICNLRACTSKQNSENSRKPRSNTSGFKGASKMKICENFRAYICHNRKQIHLGMFDTAEEANKAYCKAAFALGWEEFKPD